MNESFASLEVVELGLGLYKVLTNLLYDSED